MLSLKTNMQNTVDFSKIRKAADQAAVDILVGFKSGDMHEDKKGKNQIDMADLARIQHFGAKNIPARPFLEDGVLSEKREIKDAMAKEVRKAISSNNANWDKVGTKAVGAVNLLVRSDYFKERVPNAPATIRRKTVDGKIGDTPLIDTGRMMQSLCYTVNGEDFKYPLRKE